jgi:Na+/glutamate symporter
MLLLIIIFSVLCCVTFILITSSFVNYSKEDVIAWFCGWLLGTPVGLAISHWLLHLI